MINALTMSVKFYQLSNGMLFYWGGHVYEKIPGNKARKRTTDDGQQINENWFELAFDDHESVTISKQDQGDLRFKS